MKKMIRMAMMAAAMFMVVTTVAKAQGGGGGGGRGGRSIYTSLLKDITPTDAQRTQIDSIVKVYADKNMPLSEAARGGDADARTKMGENTKARNDAIKMILTEEQKKTFDANVAAMPQGRGRPPVSL